MPASKWGLTGPLAEKGVLHCPTLSYTVLHCPALLLCPTVLLHLASPCLILLHLACVHVDAQTPVQIALVQACPY